MKRSANIEVQKFLEEIDLLDTEKAQTLYTLRELILTYYPETEENKMYGGIIFSVGKEHFSGLFMYASHVSIEFGKGYLMSDPNGILEGGGKFRRHIKIKSHEEITNKCVDFFVKQSLQ
jgi:hypothetical protein